MKKDLLPPLVVGLLCLLNSCHQENPEKRSPPIDKSRIYKVAEMNTVQLKGLNRQRTVVILSGGILEQHGPYLPSFTDGYWNERFRDTLACILAARPGWNVLLFPTIPLGNSGANDIGAQYSFPGTYTIRYETLRAVFMDLASELGQQGFRHVFIIHAHGAPNHQRALDQAADFFNETYGGQMVNLFGLNFIQQSWYHLPLTNAQQQEDGFTVHAGLTETSSMLYLVPHLVDNGYSKSVPITGTDMSDLVRIARQPAWPGYFGSQRLATTQFGQHAWRQNTKDYCQFVLDVLDGRVNPDTVERFGDVMKQEAIDRMIDRVTLQHENQQKTTQEAWLRKNGHTTE
jgi:creatinine amidohydrolase/Fe(II)-dependent formamide hydrolase-like protein